MKYNKGYTTILSVASLLITTLYSGVGMAAPLLSGVEIISGSRGTIVSLTADAAFQCSVKQTTPVKVSVFIPGCIYGLQEFSYTKFEKKAPVSSLIAQERSDGSGIELIITLKTSPDNDLIVKGKGLQQLILLSRNPGADFSWSATPAVLKGTSELTVKKHVEAVVPNSEKSVPAAVSVVEKKVTPAPVVTKTVTQADTIRNAMIASANLKNISMLQRGAVCKLNFEFDRTIAGGIRRHGDTLEILFSDAKNSLSKKLFEIKPGTIYKRIFLKDNVKTRNTMRAIVVLNTAVSDISYNVSYSDNNVLSIYMLHKSEMRTALWTANTGTQWEHEFTQVPVKEVDLDALGKRAQYDASVKIPTETVFRVGESMEIIQKAPERESVLSETRPAIDIKKAEEKITQVQKVVDTSKTPRVIAAAAPVVETVPLDTVLLIADNVNIRAIASKDGMVVGKCRLGVEAVRTKTVSGWTKVKVNGITGWVSSKFIQDKKMAKTVAALNATPSTMGEIKKVVADSSGIKPALLSRIANDSVAIERVSHQNTDEGSLFSGDSLGQEAPKDKIIRYAAKGRDPFRPLVKDTLVSTGKPFVENLNLVGLLVDGSEKIALFEDKSYKRRPFTLKENDAVEHGKVLKIYRDKVVFLLTEFGISHSFTMRLNGAEADQEARVR